MKQSPLVPELSCRSYKESLNFYTRVLGFSVMFQRDEEGFAMLERQGSQLMIDEIGQGRTWATGELTHPLGRGINFQIETTNVEDLYRSIKESGAPIFLPIEDKWYRTGDHYTGCRQFLVQDPDGYLLRFSQELGVRKTND